MSVTAILVTWALLCVAAVIVLVYLAGPEYETINCGEAAYNAFAQAHPELNCVERAPNSYTRVISLQSFATVRAGYVLKDGKPGGFYVTREVRE